MPHLATFSLSLFAILLAPRPVWAIDDGPQSETSFDCAASQEPYAIAYGVHILNASIDLPTDIDVFEFQGEAGDVIRIRFLTLTNGLDPRLCLYGPDNQLVGCDSCDAVERCSFEFNETVVPFLPLTGTYRIVVEEMGVNNSGAYTFQLERLSPRPSDRRLPYNTPTQDSLGQPTDLDGFSFCAVGGSLMRLSFLTLTNGLDPRVEIRRPDQALLATPGCDAVERCSFTHDFTPPTTGEYRLFVYDSGVNSTGGYELSVNCILGCPPLAGSVQRNGSGVNPLVFDSDCPPVVGGIWKGEIDTRGHAGATDVLLFSYARLLDPGVPFRNYGELLLDLNSPRIGTPICCPIEPDGFARCRFALPCIPALAGFQLASQAVIVRPGQPQLTNALELVIGY